MRRPLDDEGRPGKGGPVAISDEVIDTKVSTAAVEAALERWRQSAPQLAELTDGELLGAALLLAELDEAAT